ncbi:TSC-22/dip/bun family protein [Trichinella nativa]|uniref:TSC-22/dip/bun family protein n=1 Tax=Trichinella nativa TaxID=6335 RepID=A0A1Y3EX34_9BILA|nr:TSC-22/dip/bun family protein [Trichinella nativa]
MEQQSVVGTEKCATGPRNCFKITAVESRVVLPENPTAKRVEKCCSNGIRKMSRFHIVKVLDDPYRRGRWFCKESEDKPSPVVEVDTTKSASELNSTVVNGPGRKFTVCPVILPEEKEKPAKPVVEVSSSRFTVTPVVETTTLKKPAEEFGVQVVGEPSRKFTISAVSTLRDNDALDETQEEEEEEDVVVVAQHRQQDIAFNEKPVTRRSSVPEVLSSPGCATSNSGFAVSSATQNTVATSPTAGRKASCPVPTTPVERNSPHSRPRQPIAIDSKIEQAMNLVKTHLQYAVREEVDELKNRIAHLERQVERLETENRRLRQCEMELQRLQGQRPSHSGKMQ